jgi:CRP-like cAMP-binding protein
VVSILCYAAIFIVIFTGVFGRSLSGVLATSAVLTVILGLALQDTLGNFFAGISIHLEQPFQIGDALRLADVIGRVESVTWRATTVRTTNNSVVVLPNSRIAREAIEVFPLHGQNRRVLRFPAPYSVPPEKVTRMAREVTVSVPKVSPAKAPEIRIADYSESSITYEILYWIEDYFWAHEIEAKIREHLWYAFQRNRIEIPYPTRHLLVETRAAAPPEIAPDYTAILGSVEIFSPLTREELREVAASVSVLVYGPGENVLRTGDTGDSMFVIYKGRAEVLVPDSTGNHRPVAILAPPDFVGEMALFTGEPRRADVRALSELSLIEIRRPVIHRLLAANAKLAEAFSRVIGTRQSELMQISEAKASAEAGGIHQTILGRIRRFFGLA